jgi:ABC-type nitrate/sulfonate/bicarbonate transport system substrate-binding protein
MFCVWYQEGGIAASSMLVQKRQRRDMLAGMRLLVVVAAVLLVAATTAAQEKTRFYLGASSKTLGYGPLWAASKKGFFDQQNLDVQLLLLRGTPMTVQALAGASLNVGSASPEAFIEASERGVDLVIIGGVINGLTHFIMGGKNYRRYEDLRGATLGASSLTSGTVTALKQALRVKGLEYPRDYKILVVAGGSSANLAALQSGQIAATTLAVPLNSIAEEAGFNVIGRLIDAVPDFELTVLAAQRSWAEKNRRVVVRFMKALAQANRWLYENKEAAVEFLAQEMQLKPNHARSGWEYYTQNHVWHPDGDLNLEGMKYNLRIYAEQAGAKGALPSAAKYVDQSYLYEALRDLKKR